MGYGYRPDRTASKAPRLRDTKSWFEFHSWHLISSGPFSVPYSYVHSECPRNQCRQAQCSRIHHSHTPPIAHGGEASLIPSANFKCWIIPRQIDSHPSRNSRIHRAGDAFRRISRHKTSLHPENGGSPCKLETEVGLR